MTSSGKWWALAGFGLASAETSTAEAPTQGDKGVIPLVRPVKPRLIRHQEEAGSVAAQVELVGSNGARRLVDAYYSSQQNGEYTTTVVLKTDYFNSAESVVPVHTETRIVTVKGKKGQPEGASRTDEVEFSVYKVGTGFLGHQGPESVKRPAGDPYAGMSDEQLIAKLAEHLR